MADGTASDGCMSKRPMLFSRLPIVGLITLALAGASACGSSTTAPSTTNTDASLVTVFINSSVYSPNPVTVTLGQSVNWKNNDGVTHSATSTSGPVTFNNSSIAPNSAQGAPVVMTAKGTINYRCTFHGETGVIIVQ